MRVAAACAVVAGVVLSPPAVAGSDPGAGRAARDGGPVVARGGYVTVGCVPTAVSPEGAFSCRGESSYTGFFTTVNPFVVVGTVKVDTATGKVTARGYADEWHYGRAADGSVGTMRTFQTFEQYADGTATFSGCIVEGTGGWAAASGTATAEGWQGVGSVGAQGSYRFRWDLTGDPKARAECARRMKAATAAGH